MLDSHDADDCQVGGSRARCTGGTGRRLAEVRVRVRAKCGGHRLPPAPNFLLQVDLLVGANGQLNGRTAMSSLDHQRCQQMLTLDNLPSPSSSTTAWFVKVFDMCRDLCYYLSCGEMIFQLSVSLTNSFQYILGIFRVPNALQKVRHTLVDVMTRLKDFI